MRITTDETASFGRRLAWFAGLWAAGVISVGTVAIVLRMLLHA